MRVDRKMIFKSIVFSLIVTAAVAVVPSKSYAAVKISKSKETLIVGQKCKLKIKGTSKKVKWSSTKKSVAKVSKIGKVTAIKKGKAVIKAKVGKKVLKCSIKVEKPVINKMKEWLVVGDVSNLKLNGNTQSVVWESTNPGVVEVSKGKLTAIAEGYSKIKAKVDKKVYTCEVYVSGQEMSEAIRNAKEITKIVNRHRKQNKLEPLELDYNLSMAAMARAKELSVKFDHERPNGENCFTILKDYGFRMFSSRGENIAYGYTMPSKVMEGWMNSAGHKARILDPKYEMIGVGFYYDENEERCYWSQFFFRR